MSRTTHQELAGILRAHVAALAKLPAGYTCGDASSRHAIDSAAALLIELDERIDAMTAALRAARSALKAPRDRERRELALSIVNASLAKPEPARRFPLNATEVTA